ncbi:MAG: hypothetical protein ABIT08_12055 [Bacteroidia bacterium]
MLNTMESKNKNVKSRFLSGKKSIYLFIISTLMVITASCTSANKMDENSNTPDTSNYIQQPKDNTNMRDTMNTMPADSIGMKHDSV